MSRTENSIKNIKHSTTAQILGLLANFVTRMVFIRILSVEYLGVNGLFTNILSLLSFAELGIGPAIVYSMYKPLADKDTELLKGLMKLYKTSYISIGIFILVTGIGFTPFLEYFIKDVPNISNLKLVFLMFVLDAASSYLFSYKRSFLIADQKKYIDSFYHIIFLVIRSIFQISFLILTKNYIIFIIIQISVTFIENIIISLKVDKMYPYLKNGKTGVINKKTKKEIIKNIKAMVFHKMGNVIVMGTDNILIAKFVGIIEVGLYSNYLMVINALKTIFNNIFQSLVASIGNLGATESSKKNKFIFKCIDLLGFWIYGFSSVALFSLFNPFIKMWLGDKYIFSMNVVFLIVISFYLTGRRKSVLTFREALGLFWYDRHKPIFESIINLVASITLVKIFGFEGVMLGTIISTITTSAWIEPYVLYKYGFKSSVIGYLKRYLLWSLIILFIGLFNFWLTNFLGDTLLGFLGKIIITIIVPNLIMTIVFWKTTEFQYLFNTIKPILEKRFNLKKYD